MTTDRFHDEVRMPAVAGKFYTAHPAGLRREVEGYLAQPAAAKRPALGVMVPHAGYIYSGAVCGRALASIEIPERVLLLHTKHQLGGGDLSLATFARWETPLGVAPSDRKLTEALAETIGIQASNLPHYMEHAAEVVLPFLQVLQPKVRPAVISVGRASFAGLRTTALDIAHVIREQGEPVLVIASSDMNHYAEHELTLQKDRLALERMEAFDTQGMLETVERFDITMCGANATALMMEVCRELGATTVEVLEHTTSGPVSGDYNQVVGYASARVY